MEDTYKICDIALDGVENTINILNRKDLTDSQQLKAIKKEMINVADRFIPYLDKLKRLRGWE